MEKSVKNKNRPYLSLPIVRPCLQYFYLKLPEPLMMSLKLKDLPHTTSSDPQCSGEVGVNFPTQSGLMQREKNFLEGITHEWRTPLNAIIGFSDLLLLDENREPQKAYLEMLKTAGNCLLELVNDIQQISSTENRSCIYPGQWESEMANLTVWFEGSLRAKARRLIRTSPGWEDNTWIFCDWRRLRQCTFQIFSNCLSHVTTGNIHLNVQLNHQEQSKSLLIAIEDHGKGFQTSLIQQGVHPFAGNNPTTKSGSGKGLGLFMCQKWASQANGSFRIENRKDQGTVIHLAFPCVISHQQPPSQTSEP